MAVTIFLNGTETALESVQTVRDLVVHLGYADKRIAVERNGDIVPKSLHADTPLEPGDHLEIVIAVGGG